MERRGGERIRGWEAGAVNANEDKEILVIFAATSKGSGGKPLAGLNLRKLLSHPFMHRPLFSQIV